MDLQLKFGKLGLAEYRSFDSLEVITQKGKANVVIIDCPEHVLDQERFVEGGCHLGDENRIA